MRRGMVSALLLLVLACATSTDTSPIDVDLRIEQLPDAGFAVEDRGAFSIAYQMTVRNRTPDRMTLRRIDMRTIGRSPYTLRDAPAILNEPVEPGAEATVTFTMWGYSAGQRSGKREMVQVTGTAAFESAKGFLEKEFTQSFREP